jgi:hypothetical protein
MLKNKWTLALVLLVAFFAAVILTSCKSDEGSKELNLLCTPQEEWCQGMKQEFEEEFGITVNYVRMSSGESLARVRAENDNPQFDIWWGGPIDSFVAAKGEDLLEEYDSPNFENLLDQEKYLDAKLREQMRTEIRRIQQQLGITSVYVTHDQIEAMTLSDRVVVMNEGVIEQIGTPVELYRHPPTRFVADFIGRANFVPGVVRGLENGTLIVEALQRQMRITEVQDRHPVGKEVTLIVWPEMIRIADAAQATGVVRRVSYLGDTVDYDIEVNGQLLTVVETDPTRMVIHPVNAQVGLGFHEDCIHVLP